MKTRKFTDSAVSYVTSGKGGDGCMSFRREKFVPKGGPDGGDGGRGGHVIFRADANKDSLIHIYFAPHQRAENGGQGKGKQLTGKNGKDLVVPVPCGTEIWDKEQNILLADLLEEGDELMVAKGGEGGLGNMRFTTSTHQAPRESTPGEDGQEITLQLELKLSADIGLVGFPNAGKSSLLSVISHAHPKIAAYAFTTLNPIIGTMIFDDYSRLRVADIPGLIEGAHKGVGLGHRFLKHVERSRFLIYVLDMGGADGRNPLKDFKHLRKELEEHDVELLERPSLVVANKMDLPEAQENLKEFIEESRISPVQISIKDETGLEELKTAIFKMAHPNQDG